MFKSVRERSIVFSSCVNLGSLASILRCSRAFPSKPRGSSSEVIPSSIFSYRLNFSWQRHSILFIIFHTVSSSGFCFPVATWRCRLRAACWTATAHSRNWFSLSCKSIAKMSASLALFTKRFSCTPNFAQTSRRVAAPEMTPKTSTPDMLDGRGKASQNLIAPGLHGVIPPDSVWCLRVDYRYAALLGFLLL